MGGSEAGKNRVLAWRVAYVPRAVHTRKLACPRPIAGDQGWRKELRNLTPQHVTVMSRYVAACVKRMSSWLPVTNPSTAAALCNHES
jgi:hypothetical protein